MTLLKPSWSQTKFMNMVGRWGLIGKDGLGEKLGGKNNNTIIKIYFITCTKLLKRELGHACPEQPALDSRRIHSLAQVVGHYCEQIHGIVWERERQKVRVLGREADMRGWRWWGAGWVGGLFANWSHGDVHPGLLSKTMSGLMPCCSKLDQEGPEGMRVESWSHWLLHLLCGAWVRKKFSPPYCLLPPVAGRKAGAEVMRAGELSLPLLQRVSPCTSPGQHSRAGPGDEVWVKQP